MPVKGTINGIVPVHIWADLHTVESDALTQLRQVANLPWVFHHVAVMPDVHVGKGATVGSVIAMKGAVGPAMVGVDIGCGMGAIKTNLTPADLPENLRDLRLDIEAQIPVGFNKHDRTHTIKGDLTLRNDFLKLFNQFSSLHEKVQDLSANAQKQCGTLGGGNHFIELCISKEKDGSEGVWLMLHSGSRNIGKVLAEIHMTVARDLTHNQDLPNKDLAVFLSGTPEMDAYRRDLMWAQQYAFVNRRMMFDIYKDIIKRHIPKVEFEEPILCHHNYVSEETHFGENVIVTRKGAVRAGPGDRVIIPGSMGTRSYIARGHGNADSFSSCSHGAGRRMSRGKAKKAYTVEDLIRQTEGIECRKDAGVLDEIPKAYKDIDKVMEDQNDLVEIEVELRQVLCVKG